MACWTNRIRALLPVSLLLLLVSSNPVHAQDAMSPIVWSMSIWHELAHQDLDIVPPLLPTRPAPARSSMIDASAVFTVDSPDQPVTTISFTTQSENSVFIHPVDINTVLNSNNSTRDLPPSAPATRPVLPAFEHRGANWLPFAAPPVLSVLELLGADRFISTDGGTTWTGSILGVGGTNRGDPAAVISLTGSFFIGYIAKEPMGDERGQGVARSTDEGATWTHVPVAPPPPTGVQSVLDKNHLWVDNSPSSPYVNHLYSAWTRIETGAPTHNEIELARSTDDGLTWSPTPINISQGIAAILSQGVNIKTGPNGEVYAAWAIYDTRSDSINIDDEVAIGFAKSTNGGQSFGAPVRIIDDIKGIRFTETSKNMRVNSYPVMAVDISGGPYNGNIYVVWTNIGVPGTNQGSDIDIYMIRSEDDGATWSAPIRVNQDPTGLGNEHLFPWITCDPETGALSVIFYDDRNVGVDDVETFAAVSYDAGTTWEDFKISDVSFTPAPIPGYSPTTAYFGDYLGISARGQQVYPMWTDNRAGRALTYVSPFTTLPDDLVLQNQILTVNRTYRAQSSIEASTAYTVSGPGDVTLLSGGEIRLKPGFSALQGSQFRAAHDPGLSTIPAVPPSVSSATPNEVLNQSVGHGTAARQADLPRQEKVLAQNTPPEHHLFANYPNPFNPSTHIRYALKDDAPVSLQIFNALGQVVKTLVDGVETAGYKTVVWDGRDAAGAPVPSGTYFYRIVAGNFVQTKMMILLR